MARSAMILSLAFSAVALTAACGGSDKPANTPAQPASGPCPPGQYFDGQFCQMQAQNPQGQPGVGVPQTTQPQTGVPGSVPGAIPGAGTTPPGTALPPVATSNAGPNATPIDPAAAQAATQLLGLLSQQHIVPGAKPVGSPLAGQFQQGQSLEANVTMQPGKCYTVVGAAVPTVQNLDLQLVPAVTVPGFSPVAAADNTVGPQAVVGGKPNCFKWAFPVGGTMKLVMTVSQGTGIAAAQVYEK